MSKKVLVLAANGNEEIELISVVDILRRAKIHVDMAGLPSESTVLLSRQVVVTPDKRLKTIVDELIAPSRAHDKHAADKVAAHYDAIILPGGLEAAKTFSNDPLVQLLVKSFESSGKLVAAMCASTTALKAAGVGKGKRATSYPAFKSELSTFYDYQEEAVVIDRQLITSRAPGTAMAWALAIAKELASCEVAADIARQCYCVTKPSECDGTMLKFLNC